MDRAQKAAVIEQVTAEIQGAEAVFATDPSGITVGQAGALRDTLRGADATMRVVKNTLLERAADQADASAMKGFLQGPTAVTFARGDAAAAAKVLSDFSKANGGLLAFKGGFMGGEVLSVEQVQSIARLPSRQVLYGQLVGMVASPLTGLVTSLSGFVGGLARQLQAIADQGLVGQGASASTPAAPAESEEAPATPDADPAPAADAAE